MPDVLAILWCTLGAHAAPWVQASWLSAPVAACQPALIRILLPCRLQHRCKAPVLRKLLLTGHVPGVLTILWCKGVHCSIVVICLLLHCLPAQRLDLLQEHVLPQNKILPRAAALSRMNSSQQRMSQASTKKRGFTQMVQHSGGVLCEAELQEHALAQD